MIFKKPFKKWPGPDSKNSTCSWLAVIVTSLEDFAIYNFQKNPLRCSIQENNYLQKQHESSSVSKFIPK